MDHDGLTEEILKSAVEKACVKEDALYESTVQDITHVFSKRYQRKMRRLFSLARKKERQSNEKKEVISYAMPKKRYLLIALIAVLMMSMTVMAVEPIREKVMELIEKRFSDRTEVKFNDLDGSLGEERELPETFEIQKLTYVPERYTFVEEYEDDTFFSYDGVYTNEEGYTLLYSQMAIKYADLAITSDGTKAVPITVKGKEAYWIKDDHGTNSVFYVSDEYVYLLAGRESVQYLVDLFEKNKNIQ